MSSILAWSWGHPCPSWKKFYLWADNLAEIKEIEIYRREGFPDRRRQPAGDHNRHGTMRYRNA